MFGGIVMFDKIWEICKKVDSRVPKLKETKLFDEGYIDSFGAFMILTLLEIEFDVEINKEEMNYENFQDMEHIEMLVTGLLEKKE